MQIKVGHLKYDVIADHVADAWGVTYHETSQIRISPALSLEEYKGTLFHEVIHACCNFAGLQDDEKFSEEEWISRTSNTLLLVLKENPDLRKALL